MNINDIFLPPTKLGHYEVGSPISEGAGGVLYEAYDPVLQRQVAIKFLHSKLSKNSRSLARFRREAAAAANVYSSHIVSIHHLGVYESNPFIIMEHIDGGSLADLADKGPISVRQCIDLMSQAAKGLSVAHNKGLVHRDIKPANLLITKDGALKVADFGLVCFQENTDTAPMECAKLTAPGTVVGTPNYIAPEQAQARPCDARTDIYGLGATFYYLLTGHLPFKAHNLTEILCSHVNQPLVPVAKRHRGLPAKLCQIIERCMEKKAEDRFQSCDELLRALRVLEYAEVRLAQENKEHSSFKTGRLNPIKSGEAPSPMQFMTTFAYLLTFWATLLVVPVGLAFGW